MSNKIQHYQNHRRLSPGFHYLTYSLIIALLGMGIVLAFQKFSDNLLESLWFILLPIVLVLLAFYSRRFALKAQDRAIRAEENFRHYILTGKPLEKSLKISQIVALRFAEDDEFVILAQKSLDEKLKNETIKKHIGKWRGDFHRV